jgi:hypothetical protein
VLVSGEAGGLEAAEEGGDQVQDRGDDVHCFDLSVVRSSCLLVVLVFLVVPGQIDTWVIGVPRIWLDSTMRESPGRLSRPSARWVMKG